MVPVVLTPAAGTAAANLAMQTGSKVLQGVSCTLQAYQLYGSAQSAVQNTKALFASQSAFDALWTAGFLALDVYGLAPDAAKALKAGGKAASAIADSIKCGKVPSMNLFLSAKRLPLSAAKKAGIGGTADDMDFMADIGGQKIYKAKDGTICACTDCDELIPDPQQLSQWETDGGPAGPGAGDTAAPSNSDEILESTPSRQQPSRRGDPATVKGQKGRWVSPEEWANEEANEILKKWKAEGVGTGARSGQHGVPYNRAATELEQLAKDKCLLPEVRDQLLRVPVHSFEIGLA